MSTVDMDLFRRMTEVAMSPDPYPTRAPRILAIMDELAGRRATIRHASLRMARVTGRVGAPNDGDVTAR
jgi:hypothetical protein